MSLTPHEYAARVIIPNLRALVALELARRGFKQYSIARLLSVSQPMVHKYLSKPRQYYVERLVSEGLSVEIIEDAVEAFLRELLQGRLKSLWLIINELVAHSKNCTSTGCDGVLCRSPGLLPLSRYELILERIRSMKCLEELIPEVGSNLVYAPHDALEPAGMIGLDGRIVKSDEGVIVAGKPRRGGSKHTAGVLALYRKSEPKLRWALALSPKDPLLEVLREKGVKPVKMGEPLVIAGGLAAVIEEPGRGKEEVLYLLSENADKLVELVEEAARRACRSS